MPAKKRPTGGWADAGGKTYVHELPTFTCLRCGHTWIPRKTGRPLRCAKCDSPYWDRPK